MLDDLISGLLFQFVEGKKKQKEKKMNCTVWIVAEIESKVLC